MVRIATESKTDQKSLQTDEAYGMEGQYIVISVSDRLPTNSAKNTQKKLQNKNYAHYATHLRPTVPRHSSP